MARRLPAEVLYDAIYRVTGYVSQIPGVAPGHAGCRLARFGSQPARRLPHQSRPTRPRKRLRMRAEQRPATGSGHGADQRPQCGLGHRRRQQRAGQTRPLGDERIAIGGGTLPAHSQPARHSGGSGQRPVGAGNPAREHQQLAAELQAYEQQLAPSIAQGRTAASRGDRQGHRGVGGLRRAGQGP